ncbi:hypothetical protein GCM10007887_15010 [Methylobacterium haplocladii]|nr:Cytochrome c oxidase subunit 3 [Methylobacterium haplocladii]GLS58835.1 hypothetical protein GCM10007887_15010 [Methylobacterium haplocladii]
MAEAHAKNHDYHILSPSPWPLIGAFSGFVTTTGAVFWMKGLTLGGLAVGPYMFSAGFLGILYTMLSWWKDVTREACSTTQNICFYLNT